MKTLDEVITGLDICKNFSYCTHPQKGECPYLHEDNTCDQDNLYKDALYYLKDMKNLAEDYDILYNKYWREYNQQQANSALTWDELKQMEGKPVWVEVDGNWYGKFWAFVEVENDAYVNFYQKGQEYPEDLWKRDIGKTWQAYRRENENTR